MSKNSWQNWSGSVSCSPAKIAKPSTLDELVQLVRDAARESRSLRVFGAGHSFTRLVETDQVLVSLDNLTGVESADPESGRATVWAGTRLKDLGEALFQKGVAQENLGDIDEQSIAGAVGTGTHGTGITLGSIATQIEGLTIVTASGLVVECSPDSNRDLFKAAQVSIGALGVIAKITLRVLPSYKLKRESSRVTLDHCLSHLDEYKQNNRNFEFFWFPFSEYCQAKFLNVTDAPQTKVDTFNRFLENRVFSFLSESCRLMPGLCQRVSRLAGRTIPNVVEVDYSHRIFPTPRLVKFQEMEYNVPAENFVATLTEIRECIDCEKFAVHFPVECVFLSDDDIL
ncbi:MAG: D-arabinono-1,4-lactone oxidase, partial [Blastocatellia bacterium]